MSEAGDTASGISMPSENGMSKLAFVALANLAGEGQFHTFVQIAVTPNLTGTDHGPMAAG